MNMRAREPVGVNLKHVDGTAIAHGRARMENGCTEAKLVFGVKIPLPSP